MRCSRGGAGEEGREAPQNREHWDGRKVRFAGWTCEEMEEGTRSMAGVDRQENRGDL